MVFDIDCMCTFDVLECWEDVRRIEKYEDKFGSLVFQKLFERSPPLKLLFGFPIDVDPTSPSVQKSPRFTTHARFLTSMLDRTVNVLGPDIDLLAEILSASAKKHIRFGLEVEHFAYMSDVFIESLSELLGDRFTSMRRDSWQTVLDEIRTEMVKSMNLEKAVFASWSKVKEIPNYREVAGSKLFHSMFLKCPDSKVPFGIPLDADPDSPTVRNSLAFRVHSVRFVDMLDRALTMMEAKHLSEEMIRLGAKHGKMGVTPSMFQSLCEALLQTLGEILPEHAWDEDTREAWFLMFSKLSTQMIKAMP
ncbi:Involved in oxygen transport in the brain. Hexacoordinate globin [Seminavis robusta]|uniref:Involved in oxygen transport in the brain. Hexacoordinate globin n=1 Tax=Seminavis robusta TaxID=568900 RepID=A0A9N8DZX8_9STRA|nr:Involved in oxygen transport in the brain. Hexacoordinate globin [Seminavis robusta]|eukprot:Sro375_g129480.1 Involved in oxygen transport in the brain. Hexacoordinate globin (306) ;mRNA; f:44801-45945